MDFGMIAENQGGRRSGNKTGSTYLYARDAGGANICGLFLPCRGG